MLAIVDTAARHHGAQVVCCQMKALKVCNNCTGSSMLSCVGLKVRRWDLNSSTDCGMLSWGASDSQRRTTKRHGEGRVYTATMQKNDARLIVVEKCQCGTNCCCIMVWLCTHVNGML